MIIGLCTINPFLSVPYVLNLNKLLDIDDLITDMYVELG